MGDTHKTMGANNVCCGGERGDLSHKDKDAPDVKDATHTDAQAKAEAEAAAKKQAEAAAAAKKKADEDEIAKNTPPNHIEGEAVAEWLGASEADRELSEFKSKIKHYKEAVAVAEAKKANQAAQAAADKEQEEHVKKTVEAIQDEIKMIADAKKDARAAVGRRNASNARHVPP